MVKNLFVRELSHTANIISIEENDFIIESNGIRKKAKKAVSCIIEPNISDKVSILIDRNEIYITSILESRDSSIIKADKLFLDIKSFDMNIIEFNLNISSIVSQIKNLKSFIKTINISSLTSRFTSNEVVNTYKNKKEFTQHRSSEYDTLYTKVKSIESKDSKILKENIDIEHKNVNSMFTKASGQIKLDAKNINLG